MINIREILDSKAIAVYHKEDKSNKIPYLFAQFWPSARKQSMDLKWIKTHNGLPVSLKPSNFDAKPAIRTRKGFKFTTEQMAFFREMMTVNENDRMELAKLSDITSPFLPQIVKSIYNDVDTLVTGAAVVPERMRSMLLFPSTGGPAIYIAHDGVTYSYDYDEGGTWAANNRTDLSGANLWSNPTTAKPLTDIQTIVDKSENLQYMVMSQATFNLLMACDQVKSAILAQNPTANIFMTAQLVKQLISTMFGLTILIYKKKVKDESGTEVALAPDGYVAFVPDGPLGNTWYGMTPEELSNITGANTDLSIVDNVTVVVNDVYEHGVSSRETVVSEILLPSYERMDDVYLLGVGTASTEGSENDALTVTVAEGTASGTTAFTVTETLGTGHSYKVKAYASGATLPNYGQNLKLWTAYTEGADFPTTDGYEVIVAEVDAAYKCVAAAKVVADCKA